MVSGVTVSKSIGEQPLDRGTRRLRLWDQFGPSERGLKRVANRDRFDRYFAFDVPRDEILDSTAAAAYAAIVEERESEELGAFGIALRSHAQLAVNKLEALFDQEPNPDAAERILFWLARQLPSIPDNHVFISPHRTVASLCVRLYLQLQPEGAVLDQVLDDLTRVEGGMLLGARLVSGAGGHFFSGSADDIEIGTSTYPKASAHFAGLIEAYFENEASVEPLDLPDDVWALMWSWRTIDPAGARGWIARQIAAGAWNRFDVAARLVRTRTATGTPNAVWRITKLDMEIVEELIGVEGLISEIGADTIRAATPSQDLREAIATPDTRRPYVVEMLRRELAKLDRASG